MAMSTKINYPQPRRDDSILQNGVPDPYRWLEDTNSKETQEFILQQKQVADEYFETCELRARLKSTVTAYYDYPKCGTTKRVGDKYYFFKNSGVQNQFVLYQQNSLDSEATVFLDPNTLSEDGTVSIRTYAFSETGKWFAYGLSKSGSDWCEIHIINCETREELPEVLEWVKFSGITWTHDEEGFFYGRFDAPVSLASGSSGKEGAAGTETDQNLYQKLYYHRVNTRQEDDVLCYHVPEQPSWMYSVGVSEDGTFGELYISESCEDVNRFYYFDIAAWGAVRVEDHTKPLPVVKLIDNFSASWDCVANCGRVFYMLTNLDAPRKRLITIDLDKPDPTAWKEIIPHSRDTISTVLRVAGDHLLVARLRDVKDVLDLYDMSGQHLRSTELPCMGCISSLSGRMKHDEFFFHFTSFLYPGTVFRFNVSEGVRYIHAESRLKAVAFDPEGFEVKQVFYPSKDSTKIPMFIVHKREVELNGSNPTQLYGYGGFNIAITPMFSVSRLAFMLHFGGIIAIANIRGGGEYGEDWHRGGIREKKQNVFDDFIAAAEYLINEKYTAPSRLYIEGGSNGGLLVAACVNQRPELFGCAIIHVGVLDMLRFHKFTIGHYWVSDYGCADNSEDFKFLVAYSPYHNVNKDKPYPAVLLCTADHDDRVVPLHSFKFAAQLQHIAGARDDQQAPLLLRIDIKAGHGAGKPTSMRLQETSDCLAFVAKNMNLSWIELDNSS